MARRAPGKPARYGAITTAIAPRFLLLGCLLAFPCGDGHGGRISTVAGTGVGGYNGDGIPAVNAWLSGPWGIVIEANGNLVISDTRNSRIRRMSSSTGIINTIVGSGSMGDGGDGGDASLAMLAGPSDVAYDLAGHLLVSDTVNCRVRKVDAGTNLISTIAGTGSPGYNGDNISATVAQFSAPVGIAIDGSGDIYVADRDNDRVRRIDHATGIVVTLAGNGVTGYNGDGIASSSAYLNRPVDVAFGPSGDLYIADRDNNRIRKVAKSSGIISTVAGTGEAGYNGDGIRAAAAMLSRPAMIAFDAAGNLFLADRGNNRVRCVEAASGVIRTVGGTGEAGYNGDGIPAIGARLNGPFGLAFDAGGRLYVTEVDGERVRCFNPAGGAWELTGKGRIVLCPNLLDSRKGSNRVAVRIHGAPSGVVDLNICNAAGMSYGKWRVELDADGWGEASYSLDGMGGKKPGPGIYWIAAKGGGVSDKKAMFVR